MSAAVPIHADVLTHAEDEPTTAMAAADALDSVEHSNADAPKPASPAAAVEVHVPYQADLITPRQQLFTAAHNGGVNGSPALKSGRPAVAAGSSSSPTPSAGKVKGRPSQAGMHAARNAQNRNTNGVRRSSSAGPLVRPQRHASPAAAASPDGLSSAATVLSSSSRRVGAAAASASATTAVTRTSNNNHILLRRPRFVDPLASSTTPSSNNNTTSTTTPPPAGAMTNGGDAAAAPAAPLVRHHAQHRRINGGSTNLSASVPPPPPASPTPNNHHGHNHSSSVAAVSHASLYIHPVPHRTHTHTPQRAPVTAENGAVNGGVHHRRRLLGNTQASNNGAAARRTAASASPAAAAATTTTIKAKASAADAESLSRSLTPTVDSESTYTAEAVEVHTSAVVAPVETDADRDGANDTAESTLQADASAAPPSVASTTTTTATGKAAAATQRESQVKVLPATVATHPDKKVILSRPSSTAYGLRMTELTRPSESYKVSLNSSLQSSALSRRSRQARKVLNVYLTKYPVIRKLADELGWSMETTEDELNEYKFNLCWSDTVLSLMRLVRLSNWQRTNHFPSMYLLCRKGHLGTTLGRLRHKLPTHFTFYPRTWSMRSERLQFTQYMTAVRQRRILKYFIMKPNSGCQGRGIIVARDPLTALDDHALDNYIVQEYVHRPLLLEGKKFDLRVYVLLTSIRNPSIFIFNDGLVRICTEPYEAPTEENVKNACKHLTNYAVNKRSADYVFNTDVARMDVGNKRNFSFLNRWLEESGHSASELWRQVGIIIVKTILAAQPSIARVYDSCFPTGFNDGYCCFEVLGFDVLIDSKMRPWLMEVNHTPSFATETPLDMEIKSKLLTEVWSIIDCKPTDYEKDRQREREEFTKRNMPPWSSNHPLYGSQLRQNSSRHDAAANDDVVESPVNTGSPLTGEHGSGAAGGNIPAYVHARRAHEDSKLRNFARIYPSEEPEVQVVYDTIQNLALAESANNRLYYNSTVAVPVVPPPLPPPPSAPAAVMGLHSSNPLPLRARPPLLGSALTSSRINGSGISPTSTQPQRGPSSPAAPLSPQHLQHQQQQSSSAAAGGPAAAAVLAPPNGAPATLPVSSVPSLAVIRDGNAGALSTPAVSTTSPNASSSAASRGEVSGRARVHRVGASSRASTTHSSVVPSESATAGNAGSTGGATAAPPPLSALSVTSVNTTVSAGTTPKAADASASASPAHPVRIYTPRVSFSGANSRSTTAASTPSAGLVKHHSDTTAANDGTSAGTAAATTTPVKPRVTEVHRRAASRTPAAAAHHQLQQTASEETLSGLNAAHTTATAAGEGLNASRETPTKSAATAAADANNTPVCNGSTASAAAAKEGSASQPASSSLRISRGSMSRQKSPSLEASTTRGSGVNGAVHKAGDEHHQHQHQHQQRPSSIVMKRPSLSMSGSGRDAFDAVPAAVHPRQKSGDHDGRSMSTHPEPTEEELARLVALQAQLDYEAAADPQPDDEDDDYNLTE